MDCYPHTYVICPNFVLITIWAMSKLCCSLSMELKTDLSSWLSLPFWPHSKYDVEELTIVQTTDI